jgi:hypothetical protein
MSFERINRSPALAAVPSGASGRELRTAPRVACRIAVELSLDGQTASSVLRDISSSGAAAAVPMDVELGQVVQLTFAMPHHHEDEISCAGLVRSVRTVGSEQVCGLEFHNLDPARQRSIASWVRQEINPEPGDIARNHWSGPVHSGEAYLVPQNEKSRAALRWAPGMASLFKQVAKHLLQQDGVFVPYAGSDLSEGDRIYLEVIPPSSHCVLRLLAEVVWVQTPAEGGFEHGIGLRTAGLSPMDRHIVKSILKFFKNEADRYR